MPSKLAQGSAKRCAKQHRPQLLQEMTECADKTEKI